MSNLARACAQLLIRHWRRLRQRIETGKRAGDGSANADATLIAGFYSTILEGLSIKARDGASRKTLTAIIHGAMASWDVLVAS